MPSETEAGEEDEVDVCAVERIPALCSRYNTIFDMSSSFILEPHLRPVSYTGDFFRETQCNFCRAEVATSFVGAKRQCTSIL